MSTNSSTECNIILYFYGNISKKTSRVMLHLSSYFEDYFLYTTNRTFAIHIRYSIETKQMISYR